VVGRLPVRDSMEGTLGGGLPYRGTRKMGFLRDLQDSLQTGLSFHGDPVGGPRGGSSAGNFGRLEKYRVILSVLDPRKCEYLAVHFRKHESSRSALPGQWWRTFPASPLVSHEARYVVIYA
jgi:hypothetical protein